VDRPARAHFERDFEHRRTPVVVTGALDGRPALSTWSLQHFEAVGDLPVQVRISKRGERQLFAGDSAGGFRFEVMPLGAAVRRIRSPNGDVCYVQHGEISKVPRLAAEIGSLDFVPEKHRSRSLLWVSGSGTVNPLHWDTHHVVLAQITGEKRFVLFAPEDSAKLASFVDRTVWRTTALDLAHVDHRRFPELGRASSWSCVLRAGEALFIPYRYWHYMECDETTISVSWWWAPSLAVHLKDSVRERAAQFVQRRFLRRPP
jgi:hypothetical protein